jgi:hypothetical protein
MKFMKTYKYQIIAALTVAFFGCAEPDYPEPRPSVTTLTARIIPFNSVAKRDTVIVTLDNKVTTPLTYSGTNVNFKYAQAVPYVTIPAGPNRLLEYLNVDKDSTLFTDRFSVVSTTNYTSIFYKLIALSGGKVAYGVRRLTDNLTVPDPGTAKVRFFNFLFDSVTVNPPSLKLTNVGGGITYFSTRTYATVSADFSVLTSGAADYEIRDAANNILLTKNLNFASKGIYTVIVRGLVDEVGANAIDVTVLTH